MPKPSKVSDAPSRVTSVAGQPLDELAELRQNEIRCCIERRRRASQDLQGTLRSLGGKDRTLALKQCREAGIPATELAKLAGISRARLYQLLDKADG